MYSAGLIAAFARISGVIHWRRVSAGKWILDMHLWLTKYSPPELSEVIPGNGWPRHLARGMGEAQVPGRVHRVRLRYKCTRLS